MEEFVSANCAKGMGLALGHPEGTVPPEYEETGLQVHHPEIHQ